MYIVDYNNSPGVTGLEHEPSQERSLVFSEIPPNIIPWIIYLESTVNGHGSRDFISDLERYSLSLQRCNNSETLTLFTTHSDEGPKDFSLTHIRPHNDTMCMNVIGGKYHRGNLVITDVGTLASGEGENYPEHPYYQHSQMDVEEAIQMLEYIVEDIFYNCDQEPWLPS